MDSKQLGCAVQQDVSCRFNQILTGYTNLHSKLNELFRSSDGQAIGPQHATSQAIHPELQGLVQDSCQLNAIASDARNLRTMNACQRESLAMLATVASYVVMMMMSERPDIQGGKDTLSNLALQFGVGPQQRQHLLTTSRLCTEVEVNERRAAAHASGTAYYPPLDVLVIAHALRLFGHICSTAWASSQHGSTAGPSAAAGPATFIRASQPPACPQPQGTPLPGPAPYPDQKKRSCHDLRALIDSDPRKNMSAGAVTQGPMTSTARPAATATATYSAAGAASAAPRRVNTPTSTKKATPTRAPAFGGTPIAAGHASVSTPAGQHTLQAYVSTPSACGNASPTYTVPALNLVSASPVGRTSLDWGSPQRDGSGPLGTNGSARSVATCMGAPGAHLTAVADLHSAGGIMPTHPGDGLMQGLPAKTTLKEGSPLSGYNAYEGLQKAHGDAETIIQHPGTGMPTSSHTGSHMAAGAQPYDGCHAAAATAAAPTGTAPVTGKRSREESTTDADTGRNVRARSADLPESMLCALPPQQRVHVARREVSPHSQDWQSAGARDNATEEEDDYCLPAAHSLASSAEFSADLECFDNVWDESGDAFGDALAEIEVDATEEEEEDYCLHSALSFPSLAEFTAEMDSFDDVWDEAGDALAEIEAVVQQSCCANDAACADVLLTAELIDCGGR